MQQGLPAAVHQFLGLPQGAAEGVLVVEIQVEVLENQVDVLIFLTGFGITDDRPEKCNPMDLLEQHLHHTENDGGFAAAFFG